MWNSVAGCTKISAGCDRCYAERVALSPLFGRGFPNVFNLTRHPECLKQPLNWKKPRMIFVNSMSDLFHKDIPEDSVGQVFNTMEQASWHTYQVLTKRSPPMQHFVNRRYPSQPAPGHIWLGVPVKNQQATSRILHLRGTNTAVRFLSIEPLIESVRVLDLRGIH